MIANCIKKISIIIFYKSIDDKIKFKLYIAIPIIGFVTLLLAFPAFIFPPMLMPGLTKSDLVPSYGAILTVGALLINIQLATLSHLINPNIFSRDVEKYEKYKSIFKLYSFIAISGTVIGTFVWAYGYYIFYSP